MAGNAVQEDTSQSDSKISTNKQSVFVDISSVQSKNLKLVTFNPIGELIPLDENLTLRYRISKSFHPKSGDWIGLFQVSHNNAEKYMYIGFHWAQKHPYDKKRLLERLVHFRINEFNIPINCGKDTYYQFLYMTGSEKLVGCSSMFGIRICVPLIKKLNAASERTSPVEPTTSQQQKSIVPYEFFHQQHARLHVDDVVIHLCYEDMAARCCVIDPIKFPVSHRYAGCQGLKDWSRLAYSALSTYSPSNSCPGCQHSKDLIRSLKRRILVLRNPAKQSETETLKNEVNRLKEQVLSLEEALSEECSANSDLIRLNHQMEEEMMRKLKGLTAWLMEKRTFMWQNQHQCRFIAAGQQRKNQVHINQPCKPRFDTARPHIDLSDSCTNEMSVNETSEIRRNEEEKSRDIARGYPSTLKKKKALQNHNTYSGSRIGLRYLFKETPPKYLKKEQPSVDESYSGSNLALGALFNEQIPEEVRDEQPSRNINCYSGSNLSLRHLFDDRFYERIAKKQASGNTYSGSNLTLSHLFSEETEDTFTNVRAATETSSCAQCSCRCKAQIAKEQKKDKALNDSFSCKTDRESMMLKKENENKRKSEKSVKINNKKLCVYFQDDSDEQEEQRLNDVTTESNPETGSDYVVEIKDNYLVKVTGQANCPVTPNDSKSAPVSDTTKMAAGIIEVTKTPIAISVAMPKPEPRKKSNRSPGINNSVQLPTKHADEDKKDAVIQVDGLLYSGGVYWVSSELPGLAKTAPPSSSVSCQATTGVIPTTKSLTESVVPAMDGKQDVSKDSAIHTTQADISRDAKSASSLGKTQINSHGNETSVASNPTITTTNCQPAETKNLVTGSGAQGTTHVPTMVGTIQSIEMTDVASTSQLTVIKDLNIISIPTSTDAASTHALHILEKVNTDATTTPHVASGPEENKKRKRYSATGSSALSKSKNTNDSALAMTTKNNKIPQNSCLTSGSDYCNFIYTAKARLPKSPTMPLVPDDLARSSTQIQPVKPQCPPLTTTSQGTSAIQSTKSESKTLPLMSVHSTGTESRTSTQLNKVLPPPSCPLLPPNQATLQPAFQPDANEEYPPLPSARPNLVEIKPSAGQDDTSYASVTRRDKKPVRRPDVTVCSLQSLAKLAKDIISKYCKSDEKIKESYMKAAILKDISRLGVNPQVPQKKTIDRKNQDNKPKSIQEIAESTRPGNAQIREDLSAPKQDCLKAVKLSVIITEPLIEENDHSSTTKDSLALNHTSVNNGSSKTNFTTTVQQNENSLKTGLTATQDSLPTNTVSTKIQESINIEDVQTNRQDKNNKVTRKRGQKDSAQKDQVPNRRQHSKKADLNLARQHNVNTGPAGHESMQTNSAILQNEKKEEESVNTDLKTAMIIDSPTIDQVHTTAHSPPLTDPKLDSQDPPNIAIQGVKTINQTPATPQDTNQNRSTSTTAKPEQEVSTSRLPKDKNKLQQEDQSRHT